MVSTVKGTPLVAVMLIGWIPIVMTLFALLPARRAVIASFLFAWLFLPIASYEIKFFPDYNKMSATFVGVLAAALVFDPARVLQFRPKWIDLPVLVFCLCPIASSLTNGLGLYDGLTAALVKVIHWGSAYFIGRIYFNDLKAMRELAIGIFIGGLIYVPLCLFEIRMSPQLHNIVYGYHPHVFAQSYRSGGWRPVVFMNHGLMVGMWMTAASLTGLWLWQTGSLRHVFGVPMIILVPVLLATTVLVKSAGALVLLLAGMSILFFLKWRPTSLPIVALAVVSVLYILLRGSGLWSGDQLVGLAGATLGDQRASSLQTRMINEDLLARRARQRPLFGWGGWGRNRVVDDSGRDVVITDGLWIIVLGVNGVIGLAAFTAMLLLPPVLLRKRVDVRLWSHPAVAPAVCFATILALWMIDNLLNAMGNPIFLLMLGGLAGLNTLRVRRRVMRPAPTQRPAPA